MSRSLLAALFGLVLLTACAGPDPNLTERGTGKPQVTAEFPRQAQAGEVVTVVIEVTNPGPEDMTSVVVSFARVGDPSLPYPIVEPLPDRARAGIEDIRPEPSGESPPDATYTFGPLAEGATTSIEFDLLIPQREGTVGNSVQIYDGAEPERARGVRVEMEVTG